MSVKYNENLYCFMKPSMSCKSIRELDPMQHVIDSKEKDIADLYSNTSNLDICDLYIRYTLLEVCSNFNIVLEAIV